MPGLPPEAVYPPAEPAELPIDGLWTIPRLPLPPIEVAARGWEGLAIPLAARWPDTPPWWSPGVAILARARARTCQQPSHSLTAWTLGKVSKYQHFPSADQAATGVAATGSDGPIARALTKWMVAHGKVAVADPHVCAGHKGWKMPVNVRVGAPVLTGYDNSQARAERVE